jgi:FixJ family two-component response regulator
MWRKPAIRRGLKKLNEGGFRLDALVTDVQMPGALNGYALAKQVRERFPEAAIVVISGVVTPFPPEMPPNATFLAKPVSPQTLVDAINCAVAKP